MPIKVGPHAGWGGYAISVPVITLFGVPLSGGNLWIFSLFALSMCLVVAGLVSVWLKHEPRAYFWYFVGSAVFFEAAFVWALLKFFGLAV